MSKVLVTGGLGYIGSHVSVCLIQSGFEIVIVDDLSNSNLDVLDKIETITGVRPIFYETNVGDKNKLASIFKEHQLTEVIYLAAYLLVPESVINPLKYYNNNISNFIQFLEVAKENSIENIVFSSSCTVYGKPISIPVDEEAQIKKGLSAYGNSKIMGEQILEDCIHSNWNLKVNLLRYFNPVGCHKSGLIGEINNGEPKHLFPILADAFLNNKPIKIYGSDYETKDGTAIRDYIHVMDVAYSHVNALKALVKDKISHKIEAYNIGIGKGYSVLEIVRKFEDVLNKKIEIKYEDKRKGDAPAIWAKNNKAELKLNWKPTIGLDEMIKSTVLWAKNGSGNNK